MRPLPRLLLALSLLPAAALAQATATPATATPATATPAPAAARPAPASTASSEQEAGDVSEVDKDALGPLRERIRPVSGHLFLKKGRLEISPSATLSIADAFFTKYIFGASVTYHPMETLGIGLRAGYSLPTVAGSAQICTFSAGDAGTTRGCRAPSYAELDGTAPGQLTLLGGLDLQWAPIYGKMSLLAETFAHFDLYAIGGVAAVQYRGPPLEVGGRSSARLTVGGNVGAGMRFFLSPWMTVRAEFRDLIYVEEAVLPARTLRNQLLFELGVSFFFPSATPEP